MLLALFLLLVLLNSCSSKEFSPQLADRYSTYNKEQGVLKEFYIIENPPSDFNKFKSLIMQYNEENLFEDELYNDVNEYVRVFLKEKSNDALDKLLKEDSYYLSNGKPAKINDIDLLCKVYFSRDSITGQYEISYNYYTGELWFY